jgi:hypothetical protein
MAQDIGNTRRTREPSTRTSTIPERLRGRRGLFFARSRFVGIIVSIHWSSSDDRAECNPADLTPNLQIVFVPESYSSSSSSSYSLSFPTSVTCVLNLKCYLCLDLHRSQRVGGKRVKRDAFTYARSNVERERGTLNAFRLRCEASTTYYQNVIVMSHVWHPREI